MIGLIDFKIIIIPKKDILKKKLRFTDLPFSQTFKEYRSDI